MHLSSELRRLFGIPLPEDTDVFEHPEQKFPPKFDRETDVIVVRLRNGDLGVLSWANHSGGSCGCCSMVNWYREEDEPRDNDVMGYQIYSFDPDKPGVPFREVDRV